MYMSPFTIILLIFLLMTGFYFKNITGIGIYDNLVITWQRIKYFRILAFNNCLLYPSVSIVYTNPSNIHIGKRTFINRDVSINCSYKSSIYIGNDVMIGPHTRIITGNHNINSSRRKEYYPTHIKIGNNVWIGANTTIVNNVSIGENSVIGAGSVVIKNIPANTIYAGNPAKKIKNLK